MDYPFFHRAVRTRFHRHRFHHYHHCSAAASSSCSYPWQGWLLSQMKVGHSHRPKCIANEVFCRPGYPEHHKKLLTYNYIGQKQQQKRDKTKKKFKTFRRLKIIASTNALQTA